MSEGKKDGNLELAGVGFGLIVVSLSILTSLHMPGGPRWIWQDYFALFLAALGVWSILLVIWRWHRSRVSTSDQSHDPHP
jgi:hypothetical protein